jgi:hypothetical protein
MASDHVMVNESGAVDGMRIGRGNISTLKYLPSATLSSIRSTESADPSGRAV